MRIVYLPANLDGAGCYRCLFPARELGRRGWQAGMCPAAVESDGFYSVIRFGGDEPVDIVLGRLRPDVVVCQMPLNDLYPSLIRWLKSIGSKVVVELDDDFVNLPTWNPAFEATSPVKHPQRNRAHLREAVRLADAVSVSTPALAEAYRDWASVEPTVIRNYLDWRMWVGVPLQYEQERRRVRVGWSGWLSHRSEDLEVLKPWLRDWLLEHPEVEFVAIGDPAVHDFLDVPETQRVSTGRLPFSLVPRDANDQRFLRELPHIVSCIDIGLVPLAPGRFNEGKSHLKGMEYAAAGIPCIASPTESYREWWGLPGEHGYLAGSAEEWRAALDVLVAVPETRRSMGRAAREKAAANTIQENVSEWVEFFQGVCGEGDGVRGGRTEGVGGAGKSRIAVP